MYWNSSEDLRNELIVQAMRRDHFKEVCRCLHFEPNLVAPNDNEKFWKLRPMTDHLKANMLKHFHPCQQLSFDESMIAYYGRYGCKQFLKGKPIRFGYKVWSLCTPSGYLVNFDIYQGRNPRSNTEYEQCFGKCAAPLINMINDFDENTRSLPFSFYFDNLFTSFPLLTYLKTMGYTGTGTVRENRIPSSCPLKTKVAMKKFNRGSFETATIENIGIKLTKWVDNSVVCAASTCYGSSPISSASRYCKKAGKKIAIPRPCVITEYNKYMCGVDRLDQNVNIYRIAYRGKMWWSSIFTWLIDVAVSNAWHLQQSSKKLSQLEFRREIAVFYCKHYGEPPVQPRPKRPRLHDGVHI
ncbi:piggyBac transposable element-derived protein 3-like [Bactrocera neohumeralis]|uniref:piggyBac transposable element-derived protein 3-like n=1 Tax=Bactrocera neohumeralis TaxID=98809 RepID=UPI002165FA3F|nr:piggyBac transposable element-derived protein 3-like [Bactrocera neohumeralis]